MTEETEDAPDNDSGTYHLRYDPDSYVQLSTAIVHAITEEHDEDATCMEPLYYSIDPELVDRFGNDSSAKGVLEFTFHGHVVTVTSDGVVTFELAAD